MLSNTNGNATSSIMGLSIPFPRVDCNPISTSYLPLVHEYWNSKLVTLYLLFKSTREALQNRSETCPQNAPTRILWWLFYTCVLLLSANLLILTIFDYWIDCILFWMFCWGGNYQKTIQKQGENKQWWCPVIHGHEYFWPDYLLKS